MTTISSDDCKVFLQNAYAVDAKQWKRVSKRKDAQGRIVREFTHPAQGMVILAEQNGVLVDITMQNASADLGPWDRPSKMFSGNELLAARKGFDAAMNSTRSLDPSHAGYLATPGLFAFFFIDEAGEQESAVETILKSKDPNSIVTGLTMFIAPIHMPYECNHVAWAVQPFLPDFFAEVEERTFALHQDWAHVYDDKRQDAVDNGTIPQVRLMDIMRDLCARGFVYKPKNCLLAKLLKQGRDVPM